MSLNDYIILWKLSRRRLYSEEDYKKFQSFQAGLVLDYLTGFGIDVQGKLVLDLGSGIGGYSAEMDRRGARVISLDLMSPTLYRARQSGAVRGNALSIPIADEKMDFVFCASLIEHVNAPTRLLAEIRRTLRPSGSCYLSFPPFYSPLGGHEFSPFHYLGERWAIRLAGRRRKQPEWAARLYRVSATPDSFADIYCDWGLFKMTIARARQLISASGLDIINMSTRYLPHSLIRWPIFGELFTWHAQFLLKPCST